MTALHCDHMSAGKRAVENGIEDLETATYAVTDIVTVMSDGDR